MARFLTLNIGAARAVLAEYALKGANGLVLTAYGDCDVSAAGDSAASLGAILTPALQQIMRAKGIRPAPLVVSLNGQSVFPRFAKFPPVSDDKFDELVRYEVEQNVPFPIDEIVYDRQFTGETAEGDKAVMIVSAKVEQVRAVTDAVLAAGLKPQIVDVAPMAVYNAFKGSEPQAAGCSVILDIGARSTSLILVENEKIYNRTIPVAGNTITKEIAQAFGCSLEEAEELKLTRGYVSLGGVTEDEDEVSDRVSKVIRTVLTRLHAEISRSINFYRSQQGGEAPARLFLTGGSVRLPQLDAFFRETLQVEVGYLNPLKILSVGARVDRTALQNDAFALCEAAGLALRMTDRAAMKINLMPPELVEHARAVRRIPFVAAGAVAFLAALAAGVALEQGKAANVRAEVEMIQSRTAALRKCETKLKAALGAADEAREACDAFQKLLASRSDAVRRVKAVRDSLLKGMWITAWTPEKETDGVRVTIRGWKDTLTDIESRASKGAAKTKTASEMVQAALAACDVVVPESVKIVAQKDVKDCIFEFAIRADFAPPKTQAADAAADSKKKGAR